MRWARRVLSDVRYSYVDAVGLLLAYGAFVRGAFLLGFGVIAATVVLQHLLAPTDPNTPTSIRRVVATVRFYRAVRRMERDVALWFKNERRRELRWHEEPI